MIHRLKVISGPPGVYRIDGRFGNESSPLIFGCMFELGELNKSRMAIARFKMLLGAISPDGVQQAPRRHAVLKINPRFSNICVDPCPGTRPNGDLPQPHWIIPTRFRG